MDKPKPQPPVCMIMWQKHCCQQGGLTAERQSRVMLLAMHHLAVQPGFSVQPPCVLLKRRSLCPRQACGAQVTTVHVLRPRLRL